jgi:DNA-directed RNA polymerase subunit M/transcription elongation factor TFIIS
MNFEVKESCPECGEMIQKTTFNTGKILVCCAGCKKEQLITNSKVVSKTYSQLKRELDIIKKRANKEFKVWQKHNENKKGE